MILTSAYRCLSMFAFCSYTAFSSSVKAFHILPNSCATCPTFHSGCPVCTSGRFSFEKKKKAELKLFFYFMFQLIKPTVLFSGHLDLSWLSFSFSSDPPHHKPGSRPDIFLHPYELIRKIFFFLLRSLSETLLLINILLLKIYLPLFCTFLGDFSYLNVFSRILFLMFFVTHFYKESIR